MTAPAIIVEDLGKCYVPRDGSRPSSLKGRLLSGYRAPRRQPFWGLRHISFTVPRGRAVGVVGLNGAGKSTLLRLIGGVGKPSEGQVRIQGRIGALLDIGAGLTEDLTGRENIYLLGVIAGMLRSEVAEQFEAIVAFAELEAFIDAPVRTYSTGMRMRLAFAVAVHTEPDVLLVDEVLAVGDQAFQRKCMRRINEFRASGCTIFFVSHDESQVRAVCDHVILLQGGRLVAYGPIDETLALYGAAVDAKDQQASGEGSALPQLSADGRLEAEVNRFGNGAMLIEAVRARNQFGRPVAELGTGEALDLEFDFRVTGAVQGQPIALFGIYASDDTVCFETNSQIGGATVSVAAETGHVTLQIERLDLAPGEYRVTVGLFSEDWATVYDYHAEVYPLRIRGTGPAKGYLNPPVRWPSSTGTGEAG